VAHCQTISLTHDVETNAKYLHSIVLLEVMDKEWSLPIVWPLFLILGIIGFVLGRRTWWACIPVIAGITLLAVGQLSEMHDSVVGPDILSEPGHSYFVQSYAAIVISFVLALGGMIIGRIRKKGQTG
jgi:hypothetical protein